MDEDKRRELITQYGDGPAAVSKALESVELDGRPAPGEWTPREIVHHLSDATQVAAVRLRRLLAEDDPRIEGYDEETYARLLHYDRPIETSLASFAASVASSVELLEALSPQQWERRGTHSEMGEYSVETWIEVQAQHVKEHAEQILRCKR